MTDNGKKRVLITGVTGQDGSYLAEMLLNKNYEVFGLVRRLSKPNLSNVQSIKNQITLIDGDLGDYVSVLKAVKKAEPDEIYNLGAQSFVGTSWGQAEYTSNVTGLGAIRIFEAARQVIEDTGKEIKVYQASSSEMYGNTPAPQNEDSRMLPRSPYGAAKLYAHHQARVYRESHNMFITCGILFNHESERRGIEFVTQRVAEGVANIKLGLSDELTLGNLDAKRDWGYAPDYVDAMWRMLQIDHPDDFVIATGQSHSVKEFVELAFEHADLDWQEYIKTDSALIRPAEIHELRGDYSKAYDALHWEPKTSFERLVQKMVDAQISSVKNRKYHQ